MTSDPENSILDREKIGLCSTCRFLRKQTTKRGSVFLRCARADRDEIFDRYPALPVRDCRGFEPDHDFGME